MKPGRIRAACCTVHDVPPVHHRILSRALFSLPPPPHLLGAPPPAALALMPRGRPYRPPLPAAALLHSQHGLELVEEVAIICKCGREAVELRQRGCGIGRGEAGKPTAARTRTMLQLLKGF